jgi:hypothetical protein
MFKDKEQVLIVPVNYVSHIDNGFTGSDLKTKNSYSLYDSIGIYKPLYEIRKNICLIRISTCLIVKNQYDEYLVKELYDKQKRPNIEMGLNSYIKSSSGNYQAIYNQLNTMTYYTFKESLDFKFIGYIRDLANDNVNSILGTVYYTESNKENFAPKSKHELYEHKWYNKQELINRYGRATSWSKIIIDMIVDESIKEYI